MNERLRLERAVDTPDGAGGFETSWQAVTPLRAALRRVMGRERASAEQTQARTAYEVTLYNVRDLRPEDRLVWVSNGGVVLAITDAADPGPQPRFRTLYCESGGPS